MEDLSAKKHSIVPAFAFKKRKAFAELQTLRRRERDSNSWNPNQVRRFSKPVVSATHPSLQDGSAYETRTRVPGVRGRYPNR